jgi:hypothetical protein
MKKEKIIEMLREDEHYYGDFGKQYLSNSDISTLLKNPLALKEPSKTNAHFLVGGYFHTAILEPDKLKKFKIVDSSSRNTKVYKEMSGGEMCLLQHEVDLVDNLISTFGQMWKGKADVVNHNEKLIIDLKTTSDLDNFKWNAKKYNYDSQAYIYRKLFGYEFIFIAIDKKSGQIGLFDCSDKFYSSGEEKVEKASEAYDLFYNTEGFDPHQYFINQTL